MIIIIDQQEIKLNYWDGESFNNAVSGGCEHREKESCFAIPASLYEGIILYTDCKEFFCLPNDIRQQLKSQA